jgi:hypothetical protein
MMGQVQIFLVYLGYKDGEGFIIIIQLFLLMKVVMELN